MNFSIRNIRHFVAVAEELHFRRAAQLTNVAQPALSRSVQTLESELGVQLLTRNNRNVRLTSAGKVFLAGCSEVLASMQTAIDQTLRADQSQFGGFSLGYTAPAMAGKLPKLIASYERLYPVVNIDVVGASTNKQIELLHRRELDCSFITGTVNPSTSSQIDSVVFQTDAYVVVVNNDHPLANNGSISVEELAAEKIILSDETNEMTFSQHVRDLFRDAGFEPEIEFVQQDHIEILGRVALKRGVSITTKSYGSLYANDLSTLELIGTSDRLPTSMAWRKDLHSESAISFKNFILQTLQPPPQSEQHYAAISSASTASFTSPSTTDLASSIANTANQHNEGVED